MRNVTLVTTLFIIVCLLSCKKDIQYDENAEYAGVKMGKKSDHGFADNDMVITEYMGAIKSGLASGIKL